MDMKKFFPNEEQLNLFLEFSGLKTKEQKEAFFDEVQKRFENKSPEEKAAYVQDSLAGVKALREKAEELKREMEEIKIIEKLGEIPEMVSLTYIATHYFKKSRAWLYQRLNGYKVNGKPAAFTSEEKKILATALQDMATKMKETSLSLY
jgi:ABC-type Zn uptake system ZnuABC Zn-binding protein ZnuA